jgi:hypothetical protein
MPIVLVCILKGDKTDQASFGGQMSRVVSMSLCSTLQVTF